MPKLSDFVAGFAKQKDAADALGISRHALARALGAEKSGVTPRAEIMKSVEKALAKKTPSLVKKSVPSKKKEVRKPEKVEVPVQPVCAAPAQKPIAPQTPGIPPQVAYNIPQLVTVIPDTTDGTGDTFRIVGERSKFFAHHSYPGIYFYFAFGPIVHHTTKFVLRAKMFDSPTSLEVLKLKDEDEVILENITDDVYLRQIAQHIFKVNSALISAAAKKMKTDWMRSKTESDNFVDAILTLDNLRGELTNALFQRRVTSSGYAWMQDLITFMRQRIAVLTVK